MKPWIEVVIPAYNVEGFIERCLESVASQTYEHFSVLMIDDASTDGTGTIMDSYAKRELWRGVHNQENRKMPRNLAEHTRWGGDNEVLFLLDGDDHLPPGAFAVVADYYERFDWLWLTYGSYTRDDPTNMPNPALPYPDWVIEQRAFRAYSSMALLYNHPLTFKRFLFNMVSDAELCDDEGAWFTRCYDHALMMPMLEIAAEHFTWIPEVLYVYNEENTLSEAKDDARAESDRIHRQINARPAREALA